MIDCPEAERENLALAIDGKEVALPAEGPITFRCEPGKVHVYARRPGFKPYDELVTVRPDGMTRIAPALQPETYLVLQWPRAERGGAKLELDGRPVDASLLVQRDKPEEIRMPVEPGRHTLWLARRGFVPFEREVTLREGESLTVEPQWEEVGSEVAITEPTPPMEPSPGPSPEPPKPPEEKPAEPTPPKPPEPEIDPALQRQRELAAQFAEAMKPVEEKVAAWDFAGAMEASEPLEYDEEGLTARLAQRREEIGRMAGLKERMIARLSAARPPMKKSDLMLRGFAGEVTAADQSGITTKLATGKTETHAWNDLGEKAPSKLLELVVNPQNPDDWLAAGLLAFAAGDTPLAERLLGQAQRGGADIAPYLSSLAAASFAEATELLDAKKFTEAAAALAALEKKYATTPWFTANQTPFTAAREAAKSGIYETEAEELYTEAAKLFEEKELFDVRDLVEKLKAEYTNSAAVTDASRTPPFSEMAEAVANLGQKLTVRLDGKGDFKSIQEAIDAAQPNSLVEIQDNGPYNEKIVIPEQKMGLVIRGTKQTWPVISWMGPKTDRDSQIAVFAQNTTLERLVLLHVDIAGRTPWCLRVEGSARVLTCILFSKSEGSALRAARLSLEDSLVLLTCHNLDARGSVLNSLLLGKRFDVFPELKVNSCTFHSYIRLYSQPCSIRDSVIRDVGLHSPQYLDHRFENCALYGKLDSHLKFGNSCFSADPQFRDPRNLDYRLADTSPCKGKASDGGDIGCRYTPEMIEMCKIALELRARGIIKF